MVNHQAQEGKDRRAARQDIHQDRPRESPSPCAKAAARIRRPTASCSDVIAKAKANNMPNDNIKRSIKKAAGEGERRQLQGDHLRGIRPRRSSRHRGRSHRQPEPHRLRSAPSSSTSAAAPLGATGCVSWMFERKGVIELEIREGPGRGRHDDDGSGRGRCRRGR